MPPRYSTHSYSHTRTHRLAHGPAGSSALLGAPPLPFWLRTRALGLGSYPAPSSRHTLTCQLCSSDRPPHRAVHRHSSSKAWSPPGAPPSAQLPMKGLLWAPCVTLGPAAQVVTKLCPHRAPPGCLVPCSSVLSSEDLGSGVDRAGGPLNGWQAAEPQSWGPCGWWWRHRAWVFSSHGEGGLGDEKPIPGQCPLTFFGGGQQTQEPRKVLLAWRSRTPPALGRKSLLPQDPSVLPWMLLQRQT